MKFKFTPTLRSAACAFAMVFASTAIADNLNTQAQKMFSDLGAVGNLTPPQAFKGQTMNTYTGGSFFMRTPTKTYTMANFQMPYISAGCGGINAFGGSFSHISGAQFKQMLQNITSAVPGVLFQMMLKSVQPLLGSEMEWFKGIETLVNNRNINTCNAAKAIANNVTMSGTLEQRICETTAIIHGDVADGDAAAKYCGDPNNVAIQNAKSATDPATKEMHNFKGNLIWELSKSANPSLDQDDIELIMSMTGTTIYYGTQENSNAPFTISPTIKNAADLLYGNSSTPVGSSGNVTLDLVLCPVPGNLSDPCLITTPRTPTTIQSLSDKTRQIMQSIASKIASRSGPPTPAEQNFINAVPSPIYKLLSSSTAINSTAISDAKIGQYADYVAVEFAYAILSTAAHLGTQSSGNQDGHLTPNQLIQLAIHRDNARQLLRTLDADRQVAYAKAQAFISMADDIERLQRNMRQSMSQQMSDLMAFSGMRKH